MAALTAKADKKVKVSDICASNQSDSLIYLNNHTTPFFGRLLGAGRSAIKDGIIHSCWIGSSGCLVKVTEQGKPTTVRSLNDFDALRNQYGKSDGRTAKRGKPDHDSPKEDKTKRPYNRRKKQ